MVKRSLNSLTIFRQFDSCNFLKIRKFGNVIFIKIIKRLHLYFYNIDMTINVQ